MTTKTPEALAVLKQFLFDGEAVEDEKIEKSYAALAAEHEALKIIAAMDWKNAATNCFGYEAHCIAQEALAAVEVL